MLSRMVDIVDIVVPPEPENSLPPVMYQQEEYYPAPPVAAASAPFPEEEVKGQDEFEFGGTDSISNHDDYDPMTNATDR